MSRRKGGRLAPALCNILGTLILLTVIASCLPMSVPRFLGYEIYDVVSGSMEPEIPVGSVIYVKAVEPDEIQARDVIAFQRGESVIAHRVVENHVVEGEFTTRGDANEGEDLDTVDYSALVGRVERHYPMLGDLMAVYATTAGKAYAFCFALCGFMLNMLASRLRDRRREQSK